MDEVFILIFDMFGYVISWLKMIPVTDNVSLFDFSIGILVLTIVSVSLVNVVKIGGSRNISDSVRDMNRRSDE